jgi:hypothetical protein
MGRLREEAGMTLMEVLVAATVGIVVMSALFGMLDTSVRLNTGVMSRTDAMQRGRLAMDVITQELRSQVCLADLTPAVAPGSSDTFVEFYNDFGEGDGARTTTKRRLSFDPDTGDIQTLVYAATADEPGSGQFTNAPAESHMRFENAAEQRDGGVRVPFLRYYAYKWKDTRAEATEQLPVPLSALDARRVARIDIAFVARPTGADDDDHGVELTDRIMARHSDPNLARWDPINPSLPDPRCV